MVKRSKYFTFTYVIYQINIKYKLETYGETTEDVLVFQLCSFRSLIQIFCKTKTQLHKRK